MRKEYSFQQVVLAQLDIHIQKNENGPLSHTKYKINSKWIKELNERVKTIKLLGKSIGVNLCDLGLVVSFLDMTPKAQATKEKNR